MHEPVHPLHGGADAGPPARHDFSTNGNACGPCPTARIAVQQADATRYPDPAYTALRARLAAFHGTTADRVLMAASASEFIHRITAVAAAQGARAVALPAYSYGDYASAADARGLVTLRPGERGHCEASLQWLCEPSSPFGRVGESYLDDESGEEREGRRGSPFSAGEVEEPSPMLRVLDCAYAPLRLDTARAPLARSSVPPEPSALHQAPELWQLWTPNKALGLTGVRAAYALAPARVDAHTVGLLQAHAPSWPVGAHGVALLQAWTQTEAQRWLVASLRTLRFWKASQLRACRALGWRVSAGSCANFFVARPSDADLPALLGALRAHGIQLRDCASFGLPGHVRLGVLAPEAQRALLQAVQSIRSAAATASA